LLRRISIFFDSVIIFFAYLGCGFAAFIVLCVTADILMRYFLNRPITWAVEISEYLLMGITFFAAAWVLKEERHVCLDIVVNRFGPRNRAAINTITSILGAIICAVICWYGASNVWYHFKEGTLIVERGLELPKAPMLLPIPIGFSLFSIQFMRRAYGFLRIWRGAPGEEKPVEQVIEY